MDDNQIFVPDSFLALHRDARGRATLPHRSLIERYELCEDLAQVMVDEARRLVVGHLPDERAVLAQVETGLAGPESGVSPAEARWITQRLAELLDWMAWLPPAPEVPDAG